MYKRKGNFRAKLAANNIRKNSKTYIPYIISCILTAAMYYIITALSMNESLIKLMDSETVEYTLALGSKVIAVFSFIFLFYTNSFLIKRRKKEFGLLNILGMEKRHISRILAFETIYVIFICLAGEFFAGAILDKLMFLSLARILGSNAVPDFYISPHAMMRSLILYCSNSCNCRNISAFYLRKHCASENTQKKKRYYYKTNH